MESEEKLIRRVRRGDMAAFADMIAAFDGPLFGYALRLTGNHADAEDVTQESILRLFRLARTGKLKSSPRSCAFSIVHNLCADLHRGKKSIVPMPAAEAAAASRDAERLLLREQIGRALEDLPETHRSALLLREFGQLSYAEIAATMDVPESRVKIWVHRARKKLSQLLDRDGQYAGEQQDGA